MMTNYFKMMIAVAVIVLFAGVAGGVAEAPGVRQISGEIISVDLKHGMLKIKGGVSQNVEDIIEYQIDRDALLIMNTSDKQLLLIDDLRPGQHVTIDSIQSKKGNIAQKIVIVARPAKAFLNEKEKFEQGGRDFNSKENKGFRLKMLAEKKAARVLKEKQENEDAQDKGEGQFEVKF